MISNKLKKLVVVSAAATALTFGTPAAMIPAAEAITVTATVPNQFVNVYKCSRFSGRCVYQYTYQANGAYNPSVRNNYSNRYDWCWCWV